MKPTVGSVLCQMSRVLQVSGVWYVPSEGGRNGKVCVYPVARMTMSGCIFSFLSRVYSTRPLSVKWTVPSAEKWLGHGARLICLPWVSEMGSWIRLERMR